MVQGNHCWVVKRLIVLNVVPQLTERRKARVGPNDFSDRPDLLQYKSRGHQDPAPQSWVGLALRLVLLVGSVEYGQRSAIKVRTGRGGDPWELFSWLIRASTHPLMGCG